MSSVILMYGWQKISITRTVCPAAVDTGNFDGRCDAKFAHLLLQTTSALASNMTPRKKARASAGFKATKRLDLELVAQAEQILAAGHVVDHHAITRTADELVVFLVGQVDAFERELEVFIDLV